MKHITESQLKRIIDDLYRAEVPLTWGQSDIPLRERLKAHRGLLEMILHMPAEANVPRVFTAGDIVRCDGNKDCTYRVLASTGAKTRIVLHTCDLRRPACYGPEYEVETEKLIITEDPLK